MYSRLRASALPIPWFAALALGLSVGLGVGSAPAHAIEEPQYTVESVIETDAIEIRRYAAYVVAEVRVPGPASEAGNQGFSLLGGYIFGKNKGDRRVAMTAPVTQSPEPVKIAMTAPVAQSPVGPTATSPDGGFLVQFMMPSAYTLDTLPEPLDPRVQLKPVAPQRMLVLRYSGSWSATHYEAQLSRLQAVADRLGVAVVGAPVYARYNGPWVPWFLRRNEIWLPLALAAPTLPS